MTPFAALRDSGRGGFFHDKDVAEPTGRITREDGLFAYQSYAEALKRAMERANLYHFWSDASPGLEEFVKSVKKAHEDDRATQPVFVWDMDDSPEHVNVFNDAFSHMGVRGPDGKKLKPGDTVWTQDDSGAKVPLWEDKERYIKGTFDIKRNLGQLEQIYANARMCDGVTVSSQPLKDLFESRGGCENVYVLPNAMNPDDYPDDIDIDEHPDEVRVLWTGGGSHWVDLIGIKPALNRIARKYPKVRFYFFGEMGFTSIWKDISSHQVRLIPWIPGDGYRIRLSTIRHDINLCPLAPMEFNRYKSAIKWYESSFLRYPAATLAADYGPYQEITDGVNGMLHKPDDDEHFESQLSTLIENAQLRKKLASNAHGWVRANRDHINVIKPWTDWVKETRQRVRFGI